MSKSNDPVVSQVNIVLVSAVFASICHRNVDETHPVRTMASYNGIITDSASGEPLGFHRFVVGISIGTQVCFANTMGDKSNWRTRLCGALKLEICHRRVDGTMDFGGQRQAWSLSGAMPAVDLSVIRHAVALIDRQRHNREIDLYHGN